MKKILKIIISISIGIMMFCIWRFYYNLLLTNHHKFSYIFTDINTNDILIIIISFIIMSYFIPAIINILHNEIKLLRSTLINYNLLVITFGISIMIYGINIHLKDPYLSFLFLYIIGGIISIGLYFMGNFMYRNILLGRIFNLIFVVVSIILILFLSY